MQLWQIIMFDTMLFPQWKWKFDSWTFLTIPKYSLKQFLLPSKAKPQLQLSWLALASLNFT